MALVGRALLGMTSPPPPPGSGATAFSSWIAQNNSQSAPLNLGGGAGGPTATSGTSANDSSGAHPGSIAQAADQAAQPGTTTGSTAQAATGTAAAGLTSPTGQKQTLGS
jgi:hypothetical protein